MQSKSGPRTHKEACTRVMRKVKEVRREKEREREDERERERTGRRDGERESKRKPTAATATRRGPPGGIETEQ